MKFKHTNNKDLELIKADFNSNVYLWKWIKGGETEYAVVSGWYENENKQIEWSSAIGGYHSNKESAIYEFNNIIMQRDKITMRDQTSLLLVNKVLENYKNENNTSFTLDAIYVDETATIEAILHDVDEEYYHLQLLNGVVINEFSKGIGGYGYMPIDFDFEYISNGSEIAYMSPVHAYNCFEWISEMKDSNFENLDFKNLSSIQNFINQYRYKELTKEDIGVSEPVRYDYDELDVALKDKKESFQEAHQVYELVF
ncbi:MULTISPECIES: hypothetical protein [unclassified Breznakia]|uniref:hypothetical protein n=1 Tax=unclassified Breznakia TaxID=2623764 RepID=UPI0024767802|nr:MULTISPECIES: hypothetical protein [unclassified Breznakia]MDH6367067.1 hypothetical protein [Breznakia sp. PH1-1]MDH6404161.1 hypothetical protein [Breznakia sp. PF1-11]MDH6411954.1 hypothetical protein [Breznakia sp. PFB1-11]MDH6414149.1 hypothetical protein [Breznakia sp. PFB1-14]MDH6418902.1 hypothetical protein [Breznakia sp. PFB1-12]